MLSAGKVHDSERVFVASCRLVSASPILLTWVSSPVDALVPEETTSPLEGIDFFEIRVKKQVSIG